MKLNKINNKKQQESKEERMMQNKKLNILLLMVSTFLIVLAGPSVSMAANTLAGTTISNDVTVDYKVGGVDQTAVVLSVQSAAYTFVVDNKVDLTVVGKGITSVVPGAAGQGIGFTVSNTGNSTQQYALAFEQGANTFSITPAPSIYIDNGVIGTYESGTDTAYAQVDVAPGASMEIIVAGNVPIGATNGQTDVYNLLATARASAADGGGALAEAVDTTAGVEIVFADEYNIATSPGDFTGPHSGDNVEEGTASDFATFSVTTVTLVIAKSSQVISDPINGVSVNAIAIPGSVVRYTVTVTYTAGGSDATSVTISDSLNSEITGGTVAFNTQHDTCGVGEGMILTVVQGGVTVTNAVCQTNAAGGDNSDFGATAGNTVTSSNITLEAVNDVATLTFEVIIQ